MTSRTSQTTTHTLNVPGATLTYDVRRNDATTEPILLLIGWPMGAGGFGTLSRHFSDRTVVTYDPRGVERSTRADPTSPVTPDIHADDLHRLIQAIGGGPVDLFASSGGAVNALALVSKHPGDVRTLVAHEPPLLDPARPRARDGGHRRSRRPTSAAAGAPGWRSSSSSAAIRGRSPPRSPASRRRPGDVRHADRGRRLTHRPAAQPEPGHLHPLRARRRPAVRLDTDRLAAGEESEARWRVVAPSPSPSGLAPSR